MMLLEVYRQIRNRYDCEVLIAGSGSQAEELNTFCLQHDLRQVRFLGQVDDTPTLLACADVIVVPSQWEEAFAFVVAEAMACGACVLASDAGGIPEIICPDMTTGMLFRCGDTVDLKVKLCSLLDSPRQRRQLGDHARERAVSCFSMDSMVARYLSVFEELARPEHATGDSFSRHDSA